MASNNTTESEKPRYAVVKFSENNMCYVATVLNHWVYEEENQLFCKWPPQKKTDVSQLVKKNAKAGPNWISCACEIYKIFDDYLVARSYEKRKTVESSSDDQSSDANSKIGRGCRKKTYNKLFTRSSDEEERDKVQYGGWEDLEEDLEDNLTTDTVLSLNVSQIPTMSDFSLMEKAITTVEEVPYNKLAAATATLTKYIEVAASTATIMENNEHSCCACHKTSEQSQKEVLMRLQVMEEKLDKLCILAHCEGTSVVQPTSCKLSFPIDSIDEIEQAEEKLANEIDTLNSFRTMVTLVGGADYQKLIRRCLSRVFTDKLMVKCSFTGAKSTYKMKDSKVIQEIMDAALKCFPGTSQYSCEKVVMDYFRFANSRIKKNKTDNEQQSNI